MNAHQLALIEDPPSKCPYFTLPDISNFPSPDDLRREARINSSPYNSLIELFGQADKMSDNQQTQFLFHVLKHCTEFKPNFEAVAESLNLANSSHVARRFKTILQKEGFAIDEETNQIYGDGLLPINLKPSKPATSHKKSSTIQSSTGDTNNKKPTKQRNKRTMGSKLGMEKSLVKKKPKLGLIEGLMLEEEMSVYSDEDAEFEEEDLV